MRRRAKVDQNQSQIVSELRSLGMSVLHTHTLGQGAPDLVVGYRGRNLLVELKDPDKPPSARKLTPDEESFHASWTGSILTATTSEEILNYFAQNC